LSGLPDRSGGVVGSVAPGAEYALSHGIFTGIVVWGIAVPFIISFDGTYFAIP
jgi:hypothetical protein